MQTKHSLILASAAGLLFMTSCHKKENNTAPAAIPTSSQVITNFAANVATPDYTALLNNVLSFQATVTSFSASPTDNDLVAMRQYWKNMRVAYESAEAFLVGPIATLNLDPDVDTWPVEQNSLDSLLNSNTILTPAIIASLPQTLAGFHPIEYLIFGTTGTATAASFTVTTGSPTGPRKMNYLVALTGNLVSNITLIRSAYTVGSSDDFISIIENPSSTNTTYTTHKAALLNLVQTMSGICDEVGGSNSDGKIYSVYSTKDSTLQESYFSNNSWADFTNNIIGVRNVYFGAYNSGTTIAANSLNNLVAAKNLALNNAIVQSMNTAINSFNSVGTTPFGTSIITQRTQVVAIMTAIDSLKSTLDNKLAPFINQYVTD
jgi:putative iron-regulated protein